MLARKIQIRDKKRRKAERKRQLEAEKLELPSRSKDFSMGTSAVLVLDAAEGGRHVTAIPREKFLLQEGATG